MKSGGYGIAHGIAPSMPPDETGRAGLALWLGAPRQGGWCAATGEEALRWLDPVREKLATVLMS